MVTIKVQNVAQKVLLDTELLGQFSDGYWENSRNESWRYLDNVEIAKDEKCGVYFEDHKPFDYKGYSVNNSTLLEYVGDRMLVKTRAARYLNLSVMGEGLESIIESNSICKKVENNEEVTEEDINKIIQSYLSDSDFWVKRAKLFIQEMKEIGTQHLIRALNDTSYNMKEMRKDLREITKILKNPISK